MTLILVLAQMENKALCLAYSVGDQVFPQFTLNIDRLGLNIESSHFKIFFIYL